MKWNLCNTCLPRINSSTSRAAAVTTFFLLAVLPTKVTLATYSIIATDGDSNQIGGAGASCVQNLSPGDVLYHGVPGYGVLLTQAFVVGGDSTAVLTALEQIEQDTLDPETILLNMNDVDQDYEMRQNAIVNLNGQHAAWTGPKIAPSYEENKIFGTAQEHSGSTYQNYTYSAQGNVVTNGTVDFMTLAFIGLYGELGEGCDLADRLMIAIEVVSKTGQGDARCLRADVYPFEAAGAPSAGAFLKVQAEDGTYLVDLEVIGDGTVDPTIKLRDLYDAWRTTNPCPVSTVPPSSRGEDTADGSADTTVNATTPPAGEVTEAPDATDPPVETTTEASQSTPAPDSSVISWMRLSSFRAKLSLVAAIVSNFI